VNDTSVEIEGPLRPTPRWMTWTYKNVDKMIRITFMDGKARLALYRVSLHKVS